MSFYWGKTIENFNSLILSLSFHPIPSCPLISFPLLLPPFLSFSCPTSSSRLSLPPLLVPPPLSPPSSRSLSFSAWTFGRESGGCCRPVLYIRCQASDRDSGLWVNTLTASTEDILSVKWSLHYSRWKERGTQTERKRSNSICLRLEDKS